MYAATRSGGRQCQPAATVLAAVAAGRRLTIDRAMALATTKPHLAAASSPSQRMIGIYYVPNLLLPGYSRAAGWPPL